MARLYTASEIAGLALQRIGAWPTTETAPEPQDVATALSWLDMMIAHTAGANDVFWLRPETLTLTLTAGQGAYALADDVSDTAALADGVAFVSEVWLEDEAGMRSPLRIVGRSAFEAMDPQDREGRPEVVRIDRAQSPTLRTWPVLPSDVTEAFALRIVLQTYAADFTADQGRTAMGMRASWNLWVVTALAAEIGAGPVRALPDGAVRALQERAAGLWRELAAFDIRDHATPTRVAAHDF